MDQGQPHTTYNFSLIGQCEMIWKIWKKGKSNSEKILENTEEIGEMIWKMWKKSKLNSEKIWKMRKKGKSNREMIWTIWKKGKLNSEKIWKISVLVIITPKKTSSLSPPLAAAIHTPQNLWAELIIKNPR